MLSVLVPVYNVEKYIRRCVESILNQSYDDLEVILVDDGSTDESGVICDEYTRQDKRVKVIHKKNGGPNTARIAGLEAATTRYVTFVDSDDYIEENMYGELIQKIQHAHADIVVGGYVSELEDGTVSCPFSLGDEAVYSPEDAMYAMFEGIKFNWSLCDKIYRRSLFERLGDLNKWPVSYGEDTYMNHQLFLLANRVAYVPLYAYHYCVCAGSIMQCGVNEGYLAYLDIYASILKSNNSENPPTYFSLVARRMLSFYWKCLTFMQKNMDIYREQAEYYRKLMIESLKTVDYHRVGIEKCQYNRLAYSNADWNEFYAKRDAILMKFVREKNKVYIYGTGAIAGDIADAMQARGLYFDGFCVTQRKDGVFFKDKPVIEIKELYFSPKETGFILAMREKNENHIREMLIKMGYYNIIAVGMYSAFY